MLYEIFRQRVIAEFGPADDSPLMLAILEADELAARHDAARPAHTAAAERVKELEPAVNRPRPVLGLSGAALIEHERRVRELHDAREEETAAAAEVNRLYRALQAKQREIAAVLAPAAVDATARRAVIGQLTGRPS